MSGITALAAHMMLENLGCQLIYLNFSLNDKLECSVIKLRKDLFLSLSNKT